MCSAHDECSGMPAGGVPLFENVFGSAAAGGDVNNISVTGNDGLFGGAVAGGDGHFWNAKAQVDSPLSRLARISLVSVPSSSSMLASPVKAGHHHYGGAMGSLRRTLSLLPETDELESNLDVDIVQEQQEDHGMANMEYNVMEEAEEESIDAILAEFKYDDECTGELPSPPASSLSAVTFGHGKRHWSRLDTSSDQEAIPFPKVRRTLSTTSLPMQQTLQKNISTTDDATNYSIDIPSYAGGKDAIPRISPETMASLLDGEWSDQYDRMIVVDARYPYEYLGGHIPGAVNLHSLESAERYLFSPSLLPLAKHQRVLVVVHCEFSSQRGPRCALHLRNLDRSVNAASYPRLTYPSVYILDGGYCRYWKEFPSKCDPPGKYLPMREKHFKDDLSFHQRMKATSSLSRSKVKACETGVGLRRSATLIPPTAPAAVKEFMARLAPGEALPQEFPSSDGAEICHIEPVLSNCFL